MDSKRKVRLSVDCTEDERVFIKIIAAKNKQTISEYLLSLAREQIRLVQARKPNRETMKARQEVETHPGISETLDDFWNDMGLDFDGIKD